MISRADKSNFIVKHYDKIVAAIGVIALILAGVFFASTGDEESNELLSNAEAVIAWKAPADTGIKPLDLAAYAAQARAARTPAIIAEISDMTESFLASEKRVKCPCGQVIPGGLEACPHCKASFVIVNQVDEEAKKAEQWAKKFGVTLDGSDADNDGFTNEEEYAMGTDPTNARDHGDYLDSLKVQLPLKETYVPFFLKSVNKVPAGTRCEFAQGKTTITAMVGEEIVIVKSSGMGKETKTPTGYKLLSAEKAERQEAIKKGISGKRTVDASYAKVERMSDGKQIELAVQSGKGKPKLAPVDVQATLVYERNGTQTFDVVTGGEIKLNGSTYKIVSVKAVGKGAEVVVEDPGTGAKRAMKALE